MPKDAKPPDPDDDLELRPLQRMNPQEGDAPDPAVEAERGAARPREIPAGKIACPSCRKIIDPAEVKIMPDGRLLCLECFQEYKRVHGREESRAMGVMVPAFMDVRNWVAWILILVVPAVGFGVFALLVGGENRVHGALMLLNVVFIETVVILLALLATSMIFNGLDLPSFPNRLWKILALFVIDMALCFLARLIIGENPCVLIGYVMVGRIFFIALGMVRFLNLEFIEAGVATIMATVMLLLSLVSSVARDFLTPFWHR